MQPDMTAVRINIVSDVVCPWCVIGYHQLAAAADQTGIAIDVHWHPFELNPHMPDEGENLRDHLAAKYGTTLEGSIAARARLTDLGAALGFQFDYADDMRMYNTARAHQLIHWAAESDRSAAHRLKLALFEAYFTYRLDVSDIGVLGDVAAGVGLNPETAKEILRNETYVSEVRAQEQALLARGIRGVPAVVIAGQRLLSGAQGVDAYSAGLLAVQRGTRTRTGASGSYSPPGAPDG